MNDREPEDRPTETVRYPLLPEERPAAATLGRGTPVGRYMILDRVGGGGMGVVYAGYDPELDRKVALKLLHPDRAGEPARLLREAQAIARLSHPNVVAVYDAGTFGDDVFLAMELVPGTTLGRWLESDRPWREVAERFLAAGRGLAAAHAAGLVHRDFKPDNVLLGEDGRVLVADFGLARPAGVMESIVQGTPAYMAPEQRRGEAADARADQYSFCVALWEALHGERPSEPPADRASGVPGWLRQALLRGLAADPALRHPSMEALLAQLEGGLGAGRRRWLAAAGVVLALGAAFSGIGYFQARKAEICGGAEEKLAGVWNGERKAAARAAFLASGVPFAKPAWNGVERAFEAYTRDWAAMHRQSCEATRLRGEQSETLLDRRAFCLDQRLREAGALADLFSHADRQVVERSGQAVQALARLDRCADAKALMARVPPPVDPRVRDRIMAVQKELAAARALANSGKEKEAVQRLRPFAAAARRTGYLPLQAEVLYYLGYWEDRLGKSREAEPLMFDALVAAQAGGYQEMFGLAASELSWIVGSRQARLEEGHRWARLALATAEGLKGGAGLQGDLLMDLASLHYSQGKYEEAVRVARRALALTERGLGPEHLFVADLSSNLGIYLNEMGRNQEALQVSLRALAIRRKILPPGHPDFGKSFNTLGNIYLNLGQIDLAEDHFRRARKAFQASYGARHPETAMATGSLAIVTKDRGRYPEALRLYREALEVFEANYGPEHPAVSICLNNIAEAQVLEGNFAQALEASRRSHGIDEKILGASHPDLAYSLQGIGDALIGLGRAREAVEPLSRALALREANPVGPSVVSDSRWALARVLWESGEDRPRALRLARQASEGFAEAGRPKEAGQVKDWLRQRGQVL